jgi:N-acetylmuramoyl-L-alanine amidase
VAKLIDENKTPKLINFPLYRMYRISYMPFFRKVLLLLFFIVYISTIYAPSFGQNHVKKQITTIVIDAGHGGKDPGSLGKHVYEKNIALSIALKVGNNIKKYLPDVKVIYTRSTDVYIELNERAEIANKNQADLFISIHANWSSKPTPNGTETFVMGYSKAQGNLDVERKENSVILMEDDYVNKYKGFDPNSPESYIIFSLVQNTHLQQSMNFAGLIQNQFTQNAQRNSRGVKQAGFLVLWKTTMPSILIETGFITNPEEEKFLGSEKGQDIIANSIYRAFRNYKNQIENKSVYSKDSQAYDTSLTPRAPSEPIPADTNLPVSSSDTQKIEYPENLPVKVEFYLQIASSQKQIPLKSKCFKKFKNIKEINSGNTYKYIVGPKNTYNDIIEYCKVVKNYFKDAFVIALGDGKIIPLKDALKEIKD